MRSRIFTTLIAFIVLITIGGHAIAQFKTITDLKQISNKQELFKISPNPVKDNLKLSLIKENHQIIEITIFNVIGQVVLKQEYVDYPSDIVLELSGFDKGLYVLNVKMDDWYSSEKFLIE